MTPVELVVAAEAKLNDAERNLATCVASLQEHGATHGGVPNAEAVALTQCQAVAYAAVALAKSGIALIEASPAPNEAASDG